MADDSVKIIDFGVAHAVHARSRTTGFDKGTLLYMAPEQVQHKPVSVQSDIYSLGRDAVRGAHPAPAVPRRQRGRRSFRRSCRRFRRRRPSLNPAVSHVISRVVHKAMAKQPWNRFDTAQGVRRHAAEGVSQRADRAVRSVADAAAHPDGDEGAREGRLPVRRRDRRRARGRGEHRSADHAAARRRSTRSPVRRPSRQLLESARARYEEEEDPLALQKLQEVLQLDPDQRHRARAQEQDRGPPQRAPDREVDSAGAPARGQPLLRSRAGGAAERAGPSPEGLRGRRACSRRSKAEEQEYVRRPAGEDRHVSGGGQCLEERRGQSGAQPDEARARSGSAGARRLVARRRRRVPELLQQDPLRARRDQHRLCGGAPPAGRRRAGARRCRSASEFLAKYPGQALFQALKFDIEEQQRQQLSAFIADVDRRSKPSPIWKPRCTCVRDALAEYPDEEHFVRLARLLEDKRDLVNSIVERARVHEGAGQIRRSAQRPRDAADDLRDLSRTEVRARAAAEAARAADTGCRQSQVGQADRRAARGRQLRARVRAARHGGRSSSLPTPSSRSCASSRRRGRIAPAGPISWSPKGRQLCAQGQFEQGVDLLQIALQLDDRTGVRMTLRDLFVARAQESLNADWRAVEQLRRPRARDRSEPCAGEEPARPGARPKAGRSRRAARRAGSPLPGGGQARRGDVGSRDRARNLPQRHAPDRHRGCVEEGNRSRGGAAADTRDRAGSGCCSCSGRASRSSDRTNTAGAAAARAVSRAIGATWYSANGRSARDRCRRHRGRRACGRHTCSHCPAGIASQGAGDALLVADAAGVGRRRRSWWSEGSALCCSCHASSRNRR